MTPGDTTLAAQPIGSDEGDAFFVVYEYGPAIPGAAPPWYRDLTVNESFDVPDSSNLQMGWLTNDLARQYGTVPNAIKDLFKKSGNNTTFTISPQDTTTDTHQGDSSFGAAGFEDKLSPNGKQQQLSYQQWQYHLIPFDTRIGKYRLTKIRVPPVGNGFWSLKQTKSGNLLSP